MAIDPDRWTYNYSYVDITHVSKFLEVSRKNVATISDNNSNPECKTLDSNYNLVGPYNIKFTGDIKDLTIKSNGNKINNYTITNANGTKIDIKSGTNFYIKVEKKYNVIDGIDVSVIRKDSTITFNVSYQFTETWTTKDSDKAQKQGLDGEKNKDISINIDTYNEISLPGASLDLGKLKIIKRNKATNEKLAGAKFEIYKNDSSKKLVASATTLSDGTATVEGLELGDYIVKEVEAPEGYKIDKETYRQEITITEANKVTAYQVTVYDTKITETGQLKIIKMDSTNHDKKLAGAKFDIYKVNGSSKDLVRTDIETGPDGTVTVTGLELGHYIVKETNPPTGYVIDKNTYRQEVTITEEHKEKPLEVKVYNKPGGTNTGITLVKVDSRDTKIYLEGVTFTFTTQIKHIVNTGNKHTVKRI